MNRRNFLSLLSAGVAGIALDQAIPLNRVWSFPKKIIIGPFINPWDAHKPFAIGSTINIRKPQRWVVEIGDIVTANGWPEPFVVTRIVEGKIELYNPKYHLLKRGAELDSIQPVMIGRCVAQFCG